MLQNDGGRESALDHTTPPPTSTPQPPSHHPTRSPPTHTYERWECTVTSVFTISQQHQQICYKDDTKKSRGPAGRLGYDAMSLGKQYDQTKTYCATALTTYSDKTGFPFSNPATFLYSHLDTFAVRYFTLNTMSPIRHSHKMFVSLQEKQEWELS